jgi:hypothetical protein
MKKIGWITGYSILATITIISLCFALWIQRAYLDVYQTLQECQNTEN